ncbi:MAG: DUF4367 domain-containing protein [Acutalibacter sp.]|nr:DUF4367 domain-containing protein [Acutalibacter sp.]
MSTEELEAILQADFERPEEEESDMEKILYVAEVIARRRAGQPAGRYADTDDAWRSFVENYLPEEDQAAFCPDKEGEAGTTKPRPQWLRTVLIRVASVALAIALVAAAGTVTASAFGFDLWAWFSAWTQETFGSKKPDFAPSGVDREIPEQLSELDAAMREYGFPDHLLPTYLPEGYEAGEVGCEAYPGYVSLYCLLQKDDNTILFDYTLHLADQPAVITQKDGDNPDVFEVNGVDHYIMTNDDTYYAVWTTDNVECAIYGAPSHRELTQMIRSIYGG